ncbi:MAG: EAL domain-containing protein, partial [Oscillospiraceae bacterium]|nr:EAL domain-containing protein [Oscillospiraceae bacterium]
MFAYIGRQAIYGKDLMIAGYELLYRSGGGGNSVKILDGDAATREVLSDAVNVFGISNLTDGLPAYINFTRNLIMDDFAFLASPKEIVVEVPGDISVDEGLVDKLSGLRRAGYRLVLDSYNEFNGILRFNEILPMFDIIRLDISKYSRLQLTDIIRRLRPSHAKLLAERIENEEDFDLALSLDFALLQGYYFEKPTRISKQLPPLGQSAYGLLLNELIRPIIDFDRCAEIIYSDALLAYMFLRQTQAASSYQGNSL